MILSMKKTKAPLSIPYLANEKVEKKKIKIIKLKRAKRTLRIKNIKKKFSSTKNNNSKVCKFIVRIVKLFCLNFLFIQKR